MVERPEADQAVRARAFIAAQGVLLCLPGLPAVYFHSWIGSRAWKEGPALLGSNRAVNREKPPLDRVEAELEDPRSFRGRVYRLFGRFLAFRASEEAFAPAAPHRVLEAPGAVFAVIRGPAGDPEDPKGPDFAGARRVLCIQNLGPAPARFTADAPPFDALGPLSLEGWETRWIALGGGGDRREISSLGDE
jgi:sucrose phosphorylase